MSRPSLVVSDVPPRFQERTLDSYDGRVSSSASRALAAARKLVAGGIRSLVLIGRPGVGKSHLAAGICAGVMVRDAASWSETYRAWEAAHKEAEEAERARWDGKLPPGWRCPIEPIVRPAAPLWQNIPELILSLRLEIGQPLDDRVAALRMRRLMSHPGLVVLDDIGRERISDWTGEALYGLVNSRYEARLQTVATTNLTIAQIDEHGYWPALSRLAEDGEMVEIEAPDYRFRKPA